MANCNKSPEGSPWQTAKSPPAPAPTRDSWFHNKFAADYRTVYAGKVNKKWFTHVNHGLWCMYVYVYIYIYIVAPPSYVNVGL